MARQEGTVQAVCGPRLLLNRVAKGAGLVCVKYKAFGEGQAILRRDGAIAFQTG